MTCGALDAMLPAGFLNEVRRLKTDPRLHPDLPAIRAVGYRQAWAYLDGTLDFEAFRAQGIAATRQLAKRQLTWLRRTPATAFPPGDPGIVPFVVRRTMQ